MRGTVLGVHDGRGVLLGANEQRLEFSLAEWRSAGTPAAGQIVDYVEEGGQARAVFAVPGATSARSYSTSTSMMLGAIGVGCLVLGFIIPLVPTIAAFVLGVIAAGQAREERDETALLLGRIAWIGALVLLTFGLLLVLGAIALIGTMGVAAVWHGFGPVDF
jgi:hypothetical protein